MTVFSRLDFIFFSPHPSSITLTCTNNVHSVTRVRFWYIPFSCIIYWELLLASAKLQLSECVISTGLVVLFVAFMLIRVNLFQEHWILIWFEKYACAFVYILLINILCLHAWFDFDPKPVPTYRLGHIATNYRQLPLFIYLCVSVTKCYPIVLLKIKARRQEIWLNLYL